MYPCMCMCMCICLCVCLCIPTICSVMLTGKGYEGVKPTIDTDTHTQMHTDTLTYTQIHAKHHISLSVSDPNGKVLHSIVTQLFLWTEWMIRSKYNANSKGKHSLGSLMCSVKRETRAIMTPEWPLVKQYFLMAISWPPTVNLAKNNLHCPFLNIFIILRWTLRLIKLEAILGIIATFNMPKACSIHLRPVIITI